MVTKKPRIVIVGAGMAGLAAANKLYTSANSNQLFELSVVEGGTRIGGRIKTSEFCGDRIELGATWIHGIENSPVYRIAQDCNLLHSQQPWECMDEIPKERCLTIAEGGFELNSSLVEPISTLFENLMDFIQGKTRNDENCFYSEILHRCSNKNISVGSFLREGLQAYWDINKDRSVFNGMENWSRKALEDAIFEIHEGIQRTYTSADDLCTLDYNAESEYVMFPGEEITIGKGYSSIVEYLASVLPVGVVQFNREVKKIEWKRNDTTFRPVILHFSDGSTMSADHVIVTVSLGVLKQGITKDSDMFIPPLPSTKTSAISKLGYGVVNKVFLQQRPESENFPFLKMAFHQTGGDQDPNIPSWIRRTSFITPIYSESRLVVSWFTGQEALDIETLPDEEIIEGFSKTVENFLPQNKKSEMNHSSHVSFDGSNFNPTFSKVLRSQWGSNPLFMGSYSYVAVGSSPDDIDTLAEPLPPENTFVDSFSPSPSPPLQILFAGEATHRTHYSTTHGAYFSGLREANRLLEHYNYIGS